MEDSDENNQTRTQNLLSNILHQLFHFNLLKITLSEFLHEHVSLESIENNIPNKNS